MRLQDKVALVTGSGAGIGRAIASLFAEEGARLSLIDVRDADKTEKLIRARGGASISLKVDIGDSSAVQAAVDTTLTEYGQIDVLVNCAGICNTTPFEEMSESEWDSVMHTNLWGTFCCCQTVFKVMKKQGSGNIINLTSQSAKTGGIFAGMHYVASKAAITSLTFSMARLFCSYKIRVNGIAPGMVETDMISLLTKGDLHAYDNVIPMKRLGSPREVAYAALFLASDESSYITGEILDVNGGQLMD